MLVELPPASNVSTGAPLTVGRVTDCELCTAWSVAVEAAAPATIALSSSPSVPPPSAADVLLMAALLPRLSLERLVVRLVVVVSTSADSGCASNGGGLVSSNSGSLLVNAVTAGEENGEEEEDNDAMLVLVCSPVKSIACNSRREDARRGALPGRRPGESVLPGSAVSKGDPLRLRVACSEGE